MTEINSLSYDENEWYTWTPIVGAEYHGDIYLGIGNLNLSIKKKKMHLYWVNQSNIEILPENRWKYWSWSYFIFISNTISIVLFHIIIILHLKCSTVLIIVPIIKSIVEIKNNVETILFESTFGKLCQCFISKISHDVN